MVNHIAVAATVHYLYREVLRYPVKVISGGMGIVVAQTVMVIAETTNQPAF
jgi:hypothetical protein